MDTSKLKPAENTILDILQCLRSQKKHSFNELALKCGISEEKLYQLLEALNEAGFPVYLTPDGVEILPAFNINAQSLNQNEVRLLALALAFMKDEGLATESDLESLQRKLLPPDHLAFSNHVVHKDQPIKNIVDPRIMETLNNMVAGKLRCRILYQSRNDSEPGWRELSPYSIVYRKNSWYAVGYCHRNEEIRTFKISRIHDIETSSNHFLNDEDFDIEQYLLYSWNIMKGEHHIVIVRFTEDVAPLILEKAFRHGRVWKEGKMVYMQSIVSGLEEFCNWVLQYGEHAEVLQPRELRTMLARRCARMASKYKQTVIAPSSRVKKSCRNISL